MAGASKKRGNASRVSGVSGQKTKVFHLITRYIQGGADVNTFHTVTTLDPKQYHVVLGVGMEHNDALVSATRKAGVETIIFPWLRHYHFLGCLFSTFSIYWFLRKQHFDIIHTHCTEAGIVGRIAGKLAGVPYIVHTVHGIPFSPSRSWLLNTFVLMCEKIAALFSTKIITNAKCITEDYLQRNIGTREQYITIYSGIQPEKFQHVKREAQMTLRSELQKYSNKKWKNIVLMISRISSGKGFDVLIEAAKKVLQEKSSVLFVIAGDGEYRLGVEQMVTRAGLSDSFILLGERNDIPALLSLCTVFVLPSRLEGTPRAIFEAMAAGKPVIATNIAGIPEQVLHEKTGYLIDVDDAQSLAEYILLLLNDKQKQLEMGKEAKEYLEHFLPEPLAIEEISTLYRNLMNRV